MDCDYDEVEYEQFCTEMAGRYVAGCIRDRESHYFERCTSPTILDYGSTKELQFERIQPANRAGGGKRAKVHTFSEASARRFKRSANRAGTSFGWFLTITFPPEIKNQFANGWKGYTRFFMQEFRKRVAAFDARHGTKTKYIWVREPQKNGNPHYHMMCERGHLLRRIAISINARHLTVWRAINNMKNVKLKPINGGIAGVSRYLRKVAAYCVKASGKWHEESWRHWGRNYKNNFVEVYEASKAAVDYLRSIYPKIHEKMMPLSIQLPIDIEVGPVWPQQYRQILI